MDRSARRRRRRRERHAWVESCLEINYAPIVVVAEGAVPKARQMVVRDESCDEFGHGVAHCNPVDTDVPEIGDELAAGRAMYDLAQQLVEAAERDIEGRGAPATGRNAPTVGGCPM